MKSVGLLSNWWPFSQQPSHSENASDKEKSISVTKLPGKIIVRQPTDLKVQPETSEQSPASDNS